MIMIHALIYQAIGRVLSAGEKALYLLGPIHVRLVDAFRVDEENRKYKALIKEAKRVLARSVTKAA